MVYSFDYNEDISIMELPNLIGSSFMKLAAYIKEGKIAEDSKDLKIEIGFPVSEKIEEKDDIKVYSTR